MHLDPTVEQTRAPPIPQAAGRPMRRVRTLVERSNGILLLVPVPDLWEVSGVLSDTFPLDRSMAAAPRWSRRLSHWTRLVLVDRAVTNRDATAIVTLSNTPWVPAAAAAA